MAFCLFCVSVYISDQQFRMLFKWKIELYHAAAQHSWYVPNDKFTAHQLPSWGRGGGWNSI